MTYVKQSWKNFPSTDTPISAARLNHMETQYDEAVSDSKTYADEAVSSSVKGGVYSSLKYKTTTEGIPYTVYTAHTLGSFRPGLVGKSFAANYEKLGTTGASFTPPRTNLDNLPNPSGAGVIANASGWDTSSGEIRGGQILNGVAYHEMSLKTWQDADSLGVTDSGEFRCYSARWGDTTSDMIADGVVHSWSWGPVLVREGVKQDLTSDPFWAPYLASISSAQILGQTSAGDVKIVTVPGVSGVSGIGGSAVATLAFEEGLENAIALDRGGSCQTLVGGTYSNVSSDSGGRRSVPDGVFISAPPPGVVKSQWVPIPLRAGYTPDGETPSVIQVGGGVYLRGQVKPEVGAFPASNTIVGDLPPWASPEAAEVSIGMAQAASFRKVTVGTQGAVIVVGAPESASYVRLDSIGYPSK